MTRNHARTSRSNRIIDAALHIFAAKGFQEATISEISKAAGVSEATVYEYFKSKEELLFAIPEQITEEPVRDAQRLLSFVQGAQQKVRAVVLGYMNLYESNPDYSALVMLQLKTNRRFIGTPAYERVREISRILLEAIEEGIADGTFRDDTDPFLIRAMLLGTMEHLCIRWHLLGRPESLVACVDPLMSLVFEGIRAPSPQPEIAVHLHLDAAGRARLET